MTTEQVVLVDDAGRAIGTEDKATVHHAATPLHLAFSSYVFDDRGRLLLTQRAVTKKAWPGVWTNSCCGHPLPGEPVEDAVRRRLADELGLVPATVELVLPAFRYRAEMPDGVVENELCPVFRVDCVGDPEPDPAEVAAYKWVDWPRDDVQAGLEAAVGAELSPWCVLQLQELKRLGEVPGEWAVADRASLPPSAQ
ncbi:isopentenyl-diphosphate delta-isomerase [Kribbella voronezhensis]|uniref:Isopentenyl-diphosphate Delta-isomerase n=1 Tax=Kribbella voronezhensis TaxID=2512212 RepID=A0A4R7T940_9ACTN|nr:isopentenyl-diphosphate Delta-isomerase [Kribbella voronezhensis]TDU88169.1 isopentenyl-diphosphate delta-isomerase [Kribbella voronezhensis]